MGEEWDVLKRVQLGQTGLEVTELCFGVLPCGPLQKDLPEEECVSLIRAALEAGINFFDTAEMYKTQTYLGKALKGWEEPVVVATKSHATTYEDMQASVEKSLAELDRDVIEIYHLHPGHEKVFNEWPGPWNAQGLQNRGPLGRGFLPTMSTSTAARDDTRTFLINRCRLKPWKR